MKKLNNKTKIFCMIMLLFMSVAATAQTTAAVRTAAAENKVAILPVTYIADGNPVKMDEMRYHLQHIAYLCLKNEAVELKFQDPAMTNALLLKNGVKESNFREYTPGELAELLQVEYVLIALVSQETVGMSTMDHSRRVNYTNSKGRMGRQTMGHSKTVQDFSTNIDMNVYNDKGEMLYSKSRRSILSGVEAYKNGLHYLLKRTPLYRK
jgi:hypothetical protein